MGHLRVENLAYLLGDGRPLLTEVSFSLGNGARGALVGPNGAGKTTLLRLIAGELEPFAGKVSSTGGLGILRQFSTPTGSGATVRDLLLSVSTPQLRAAAEKVARSELALAGGGSDAQLSYAEALTEYGDAGGYDAEVAWDHAATAALGARFQDVAGRDVNSLSGGEQKRLALEALLNGSDEVLLLDEPDNYLDVRAKEWLAEALCASRKTVLLVTHDRQFLADVADRIVTVEGGGVWVHGGGLSTYAEARRARTERIEDMRTRWNEERSRLRRLVHELGQRAANDNSAGSALRGASARLRRLESEGPPQPPPRPQKVRVQLRGGRTGKRALSCEGLELTGLARAFDLELWYGERLAVIGANGTGKSTLLRLLADLGQEGRSSIPHTGEVRFANGSDPGYFDQTHVRPDLEGQKLGAILDERFGLTRNDAMWALARYELAPAAKQTYESLSGGQQARLQILLLELAGSRLLLLDEPTDNLDLASADALQAGLETFEGTVMAVTHDRWFAADFDRYLFFSPDGLVSESEAPSWAGDRR
jgi:ATPase subunit of ABC transporter with duplicated ATPase domains